MQSTCLVRLQTIVRNKSLNLQQCDWSKKLRIFHYTVIIIITSIQTILNLSLFLRSKNRSTRLSVVVFFYVCEHHYCDQLDLGTWGLFVYDGLAHVLYPRSWIQKYRTWAQINHKCHVQLVHSTRLYFTYIHI